MTPHRHRAIGLVLAGLIGAAACGQSSSSSAPVNGELPTIPFEKYTLDNGLEVILAEDHRLPLVAVDIWYHVGPANEADGRTGFAHLFEHMMFQGSKHVEGDSHFRILETAGATSVNGTTSFDRTNYFQTLPANQLELGLWLESDRMGFLLDTVDAQKLANQQDVVRNERRQSRENVPYGMAREVLYQTLFPEGHPYYGNVIGSHADIQAAELDDVKAFFKQYYAPNNASLAIVGDFDTATAKPLIEKYFGPLRRGPDLPPVTAETPPITSERRAVVPDRVELPRVYMAWLTPPFFEPGDADADAAGSILGGNNASRLYKALVYEQQIAQDVQAYQASQTLGSTFQIVATVRPGHTVEEVETAITQQVERLRREAPDAQEVERAVNTFETQMLGSLESFGGFGGVADTLNMFNHFVGDPGYLPTYIEEHRNVTPASIRAFAEQYLAPSARVVVHVVPGEPDFGPEVPTPAPPQLAPGTGAEAVNEAEPWRATPPGPSGPLDVSLPAPDSFRLENGLTIIQHVRPGLPIATASLVFQTGSDANPIDRSGLANFATSLLDQGTTSRTATEIADDVAQIGASLNASSSKDSMAVSVGALTRNFDEALELLADISLRPTFPAEEVERQRQSRLASLASTRQSANAVASINAVAALFGSEHVYGYIELGTEEAARATSRDDLAGFWEANFVPDNAALVVTGPMTQAELRPLVEEAFGAWTGGAVPAATLGTAAPTPARIILSDRPGAPQTQLLVAGPGVERNAPDYPAINVMNTVLGGLFSSRINLNLREEHGYSYGAFSQFVFRKHPGIFWVTTGVRTDVTAPAVSEILREIRQMTEAPVSDEELEMAKDALVRTLPSSFETSAGTVNLLSELFVYRLGLDYYGRYPDAVRAVTAADALAAARAHLDPAALKVIAVGDRSAIEAPLGRLGLGPVEIRDADGNVVQ
jgi:zinc protease